MKLSVGTRISFNYFPKYRYFLIHDRLKAYSASTEIPVGYSVIDLDKKSLNIFSVEPFLQFDLGKNNIVFTVQAGYNFINDRPMTANEIFSTYENCNGYHCNDLKVVSTSVSSRNTLEFQRVHLNLALRFYISRDFWKKQSF